MCFTMMAIEFASASMVMKKSSSLSLGDCVFGQMLVAAHLAASLFEVVGCCGVRCFGELLHRDWFKICVSSQAGMVGKGKWLNSDFLITW